MACALCALLSFGGASLHAQGTAAASPASNANPPKSATHPIHPKKRVHPAKPEVQPEPVAAVVPPTPPPPDWPVNDKPAPASVEWNGRVLSISATNSSLQQILSDVSTATGVKVDGASGDQRVYGSYGPAPAREVLSQLLDGSGYNVLMIGDQGQGTPRSLVLTVKSNAPAPNPGLNAQARQNPDDDAEEPEQAEPIDPSTRRLPGLNRSPQQMMQEAEQRRLQMQQQQQQQPPPQQPQQGAPVTPQPQPGQPND
jgi:hypothetical protein